MVAIFSVGALRKVLAGFDDDLPLKFTYADEEAFLLSDVQLERLEGEGENAPALAVNLMTLDGLAGLLADHEARENHG